MVIFRKLSSLYLCSQGFHGLRIRDAARLREQTVPPSKASTHIDKWTSGLQPTRRTLHDRSLPGIRSWGSPNGGLAPGPFGLIEPSFHIELEAAVRINAVPLFDHVQAFMDLTSQVFLVEICSQSSRDQSIGT